MVMRQRKKQRSKGRGLWRWLGLGALGLGASLLLRREPRRRRPRALPPPAPPSPRGLPDDVDLAWVPGPVGSLHVAERHREGALPVVFVHGLGGRLEHWTAPLHFLGPAVRGVAFDLPGHGRSDPAAAGIAELASSIGAVADALGLRRSVLVGHSLGAAAAIAYAGAHPGRVAGLLLVDPSGDQSRIPEAQRTAFLESLRRDPGGELAWSFRQLLVGAEAAVADRVLEDLAAVPGEVLLAALESSFASSPLAALERYPGPVAMALSEHNDLPYSLHRLRPDLPRRRLAGGHWLMLTRPEAVWEMLLDVLDTVTTSTQSPPRHDDSLDTMTAEDR